MIILKGRRVRRALLVVCGIIAPLFALALESRAAPDAQPANVPIIYTLTPTCYQPVPEENACYINWSYMDVASDPSYSSYIVAISITVGNRLRARYGGFFQTVAYLEPGLRGAGLKVACGPRGADGWGNTYAWQVSASNTNGLGTSIGDSIRCPGTTLEFLPSIRR